MSVQDETKSLTRRALTTGGLAVAGAALLSRQAQAADQAAAAAMVAAGPKPTDDAGLVVGDVKFQGFDQMIGGYRAYPAGKRNLPTIVCLPMIKGVNFPPHRDMVRRLAREGFYVIMPDLWIRKGDANAVPFPQLVNTLVAAPNIAEQQLDIDAAIAFAAKEGANTKKLGMFGYDNGGRVIYRYMAMNPKVVAGVVYSSPVALNPLSTGATEAKPAPIELAPQMNGRLLGVYGDQEGSIKPAEIEEMKAALARAGDSKSQIVIYPGKHGFITNFDSTEESKKAWAQGVAWLKSHGLA
jgi:carboxymethylenebutenolidase